MEVTLEELKRSSHRLVEIQLKPDIDFGGAISGHELAERIEDDTKTPPYSFAPDGSLVIAIDSKKAFEMQIAPLSMPNSEFRYRKFHS